MAKAVAIPVIYSTALRMTGTKVRGAVDVGELRRAGPGHDGCRQVAGSRMIAGAENTGPGRRMAAGPAILAMARTIERTRHHHVVRVHC